MKGGRPCVIPGRDGRLLVPSVVSFDSSKGVLVGHEAPKPTSCSNLSVLFIR